MRSKSQNNMEDVELDDNEVLLLSAAIACTSVVLRRKKKKRRYWIHPIIRQRDSRGDYMHLIAELGSDGELIRRYFRGHTFFYFYLLLHDNLCHTSQTIG